MVVALFLFGAWAHAQGKPRQSFTGNLPSRSLVDLAGKRVVLGRVKTDLGNGKRSVTTFSTPSAGGDITLRVSVARYGPRQPGAAKVGEYTISRFCEVGKVAGGDNSGLTGRFQRNMDRAYPKGRSTNPFRARSSPMLTKSDLLKLDRALNAALGTGRPWDYKDLGEGHLGRWTKERRAMLGPEGRRNTPFGRALRHAIRQFREGERLADDSHIRYFGVHITDAMASATPSDKARLLKILEEATVTRRPANFYGYDSTDRIIVHSPTDSVTIQHGKIQNFDGERGMTMAQVRNWIAPRRQLPRP
jgi:hypothetical protein